MFGTSERILTTHAGSLPRPPDLLQMMYDRGAGKPVDGAALEARIRSAVEEIVARQPDIGLDLISDGEMSKSGFSTYIYERLSGFGTFAGWSACDPAVAWLKLQALVDGAGEASRALFGGSVVPV
jgi:methionine synthase II (cobalamin-independent)